MVIIHNKVDVYANEGGLEWRWKRRKQKKKKLEKLVEKPVLSCIFQDTKSNPK